MSHGEDHASRHIDGNDDIQDATDGQKGLATSTQIGKLDAVEALADVTGNHAPKIHDIDDDTAHGGVTGTENNLVSLDANKLPKDSTILASHVALDKGATLTNTSVALTAADSGKTYGSVGGGDNPVVFTLPSAAVANIVYRFVNAQNGLSIQLDAGTETFYLPIGANPNKIQADHKYSIVEIVSLGSPAIWIIRTATGVWKDADSGTNFRLYDGNLPGAVENNLASFDALGNAKDSGLSAGKIKLEVHEASDTLTASETGTMHTTGGVTPVVLTLPSAPPDGTSFVFVKGARSFGVLPPGVETISMPWGDITGPNKLTPVEGTDEIHLVYIASFSTWIALSATGTWYDSNDSSLKHIYDGRITSASENNLVSLDSLGNIKDSGAATATPSSHAPSHKDGGSDELDVSELAGAIGGAGEVPETDGDAVSWVEPDGRYDPKIHDIDSATFHGGVGSAVEDNFLSFTSGGLPQDSGLSGKLPPEAHAADDTLTASETGTLHSTAGGDPATKILTLPASPASGTHFYFDKGLSNFEILADTESIEMPWGSVTDTKKIRCENSEGGRLHLHFNGTSWFPMSGRGEWYLSTDVKKNYIFEAHVNGTTEDNIATFDAEGNVKDSGAATAAPASGLVARTASLTLTSAESGNHYVAMTSGDDPVVFTLPPNASAPTGTHYIFERGTANISIVCSDSQADVPWGTVNLWQAEGLNCDTPGGTIHLIKTAANIWRSFEGTGEWYDRDTPASQRHYDGNVSGATEDNLASFDGGGNLKDSGTKASDISWTKYDATVGSTGDYADIQSAITEIGGWDIKLLLVTDVTEDSNIGVTGINLVIDLSAYILTMGNYSFTCNGGSNIHIFGNGVNSRAEIDYTHTSSVALFTSAEASSTIRLEDFVMDNNSTAVTCPIVSSGIQLFDQLRIECANYDTCGLYDADPGSRWTNIEIVGGGTGCSEVLRAVLSKMLISNILFSGTFHATNSMVSIDQDIIMMNAVFNVSTAKALVTLADNAGINGLRTPGFGIDVDMTGVGAFLLDAELNNGDVDVTGDHAHLDHVVSTGRLDMDDATASSCLIDNCRFSTALEVDGDKNKFSNCDFLGGGSVVSGADDNGFVNCQFGPDTPADVLTLTIASGANRTRVVGCMTDIALSDSGTGTAVAANTVY